MKPATCAQGVNVVLNMTVVARTDYRTFHQEEGRRGGGEEGTLTSSSPLLLLPSSRFVDQPDSLPRRDASEVRLFMLRARRLQQLHRFVDVCDLEDPGGSSAGRAARHIAVADVDVV